MNALISLRVLVGKYGKWDHLKNLGIYVRVILKWILKKWVWGGLDFSGSGYYT
jgi:hypothetical protein